MLQNGLTMIPACEGEIKLYYWLLKSKVGKFITAWKAGLNLPRQRSGYRHCCASFFIPK